MAVNSHHVALNCHASFGLDNGFVLKDKSFEYEYRWLKHTGDTHPIPYGTF